MPRFTEFEKSEKMEDPRLEIMRDFQCRLLAALLPQNPSRPLAPRVAEETGRGSHIPC